MSAGDLVSGEIKHTALPWVVEEPNDGSDGGPITHKYSVRGPGIAPVVSFKICELSSINCNEKADAEFIVRACNAHDDLVKALQDSYAAAHAVLIAGGDYGDDLSDLGLRYRMKTSQATISAALAKAGEK